MNKKNKIRLKVTDEEDNQDICNGLFSPKELTKTIKKIKQKYS